MGPVINAWVHLGVSCDRTHTTLYYKGIPISTLSVADTNFGQLALDVNRAGDNWFGGMIDEVRVYNRALSDGEIAALADLHQPFDKPFAD